MCLSGDVERTVSCTHGSLYGQWVELRSHLGSGFFCSSSQLGAGWGGHNLCPHRGLDTPPRGWSVSLHSGDSWQDLLGCDFVLDLIGKLEDLGDPTAPRSYPITSRSL